MTGSPAAPSATDRRAFARPVRTESPHAVAAIRRERAVPEALSLSYVADGARHEVRVSGSPAAPVPLLSCLHAGIHPLPHAPIVSAFPVNAAAIAAS